MKKFNVVALGGTFDIIHKGHLKLLSEAFSVSSKVIIGLTSDDLAIKKGKTPQNKFEKRYETLKNFITQNFQGSIFEISKLENDFGPAVLEKDVQALIVSDETSNQGTVLNNLRIQKNLPLVEVLVVPMVLAEDGNRISTTRIKNLEIDSSGNLLPID